MPKCDFKLWHGFSLVNLLHIFKTPFPKNISGGLFLSGVPEQFKLRHIPYIENHLKQVHSYNPVHCKIQEYPEIKIIEEYG